MLGKTLVKVEEEIPARLWNPGNEDVIIYQGTTTGILTAIQPSHFSTGVQLLREGSRNFTRFS